ncbi:MAG: adenosine deaminase [Planctomycetota bacterium]|jgi:adenosine deaminase
MAPDDLFHRLPKVELHLHLEGAIPLPALWEIVRKYGGDREVPDPEALAERFRFRDFAHFIDVWVWKNGFLREYDDFTFAAESVARSLLDQNILYVEAFYSPGDFRRHGLVPQRLTEAVRRGLDRVEGVEVNLVADFVRDFGAEHAARTLDEVIEVRDLGVIGIGIGGLEREFPPELFGDVFREARRRGFRTPAHAGEAAGAESVWGAIRELEVDRIGHGTRAAEDERLLAHLAERRIPLEMCPGSNVRTGVVPDLAAHPVRDFMRRGIVVTVNTDDPTMFGNSLAGEYRALVDLGLLEAEIRTLVRNAIDSSWAGEETRGRLEERLREFERSERP